jgi:hypothetical protein
MFESIDIYCERLSAAFWAEPVNALTNASFFIAAIMALILARRESALDWRSGLLIGLVFIIGTGSTLFHTFGTVWAMLTDVLPILFYQICFIVLYNRYVIGLKCWKSFAILGAFLICMVFAMQLPREWLNGSLEYAPALIFVAAFGVYHLKNATRERHGLLLAAAVFTVSVTFRSIDDAVCAAFPLGTHFLWHCLNGVVLYMTTRAFILNRKSA